jgi:hypothetical protein
MDLNPKLTKTEQEILNEVLPLQNKHIFTKSIGDGEIIHITRKNDLSGIHIYFHSNLHGQMKLDGIEFLEEIIR